MDVKLMMMMMMMTIQNEIIKTNRPGQSRVQNMGYNKRLQELELVRGMHDSPARQLDLKWAP